MPINLVFNSMDIFALDKNLKTLGATMHEPRTYARASYSSINSAVTSLSLDFILPRSTVIYPPLLPMTLYQEMWLPGPVLDLESTTPYNQEA